MNLVGTWVKLPTPEVVEILAAAGLDLVVIDLEHGTLDLPTVSQMIGVARDRGIRPFVRVPGRTARDVQPVLDAGAAGIVVPHVDDVAAAREAVQAIRFPPLGERGASPSGRAGGWGQSSLPAYLSTGADVCVVAQIESLEGLDNIGAIAGVLGIDAVFIGEVDLATSTGMAVDVPALRARIDEAEATCREGGFVLGGGAANGTEAAHRFARGYQLVMIGTDIGLLRHAATQARDTALAAGTAKPHEAAKFLASRAEADESAQFPAGRAEAEEPAQFPAGRAEAEQSAQLSAGTAKPREAALPAGAAQVRESAQLPAQPVLLSRAERLAVAAELTALVTEVWFEIDHTDGSKVSSYFTGDASLEINGGAVRGRAGIDEFYSARHARGPRVSRHLVTNLHVIEADERSARVLSALVLYAEDGEAPRRQMTPALVADVYDEFVRVDGRWLIQDRRIVAQFVPEQNNLTVPTR